MYLFTARYRGQAQSILVHKDMSVQEFLEALSYSLQLPDGVIVGFQDRQGMISYLLNDLGLIITPSYICSHPQDLRNETYDVMLKSSTLQQQTPQHQTLPNSQLQSSFLLDQQINQPLSQNYINETNQYTRGRSNIGDRTVGNFSNIPPIYYSQEDEVLQIVNLVRSLPFDTLFTENVKNKIIEKIRQKDSGILGAYQLYLNDGDIDGFKARVIHRALTPNISEYPSSASTANFNWNFSRTSTQGGYRPSQTRDNSRMRNVTAQVNLTQDRFLPVILRLENGGLLDEQTAILLKTLVLEENVEVFKVINGYLARAITEQELAFKLGRLAQQLGTYIERPQSPLPRKKNQLLNYVNSLARFHFSDPDDIQLLNKLIQEENEFVLSCFDVFESDKDHDNLIDSLHRIIEKSKTMGLHIQSVTASSFYNQGPWPRQHIVNMTPNDPRNQHSLPSSLARSQPYISKWEERGIRLQDQVSQPLFTQSNIHASAERPQGATGSRRQGGPVSAQSVPHQFGQTTVHNVALIPNYFSSGEEENLTSINQRQQIYPTQYSGHKNANYKNDPIREREYEQVRESEMSELNESRKHKKKQSKQKQVTSSEEEQSEEEKAKSKKKKKDKKHHSKKKSESKKSRKHKKRQSSSEESETSESSESSSKDKKKKRKQQAESSDKTSSDSDESQQEKSKKSKCKSSTKDKNKKDKKSKSKPKKVKLSNEDIKQILEDEDVKVALRIENYAILKSLLHKKDKDIFNILEQFIESESSEYLINSFEGKTEDTLYYLFQNNFNNLELNALKNLRSKRNPDYHKAFKKFQKKFKEETLINKLRSIIEETAEPQISSTSKPLVIKQSKKQQLESIFQMVLYGDYIGSEKGRYLQELFDEEDQELYRILESYNTNNNYLNVKNMVADLMNQNFKEEITEFTSLKQAIDTLQRRGEITTIDASILKDLSLNNDRHLNAAWEAYTVIKNSEDLADTFAVLCDVKRESSQQDKQKATAQNNQKIDKPAPRRSAGQQEVQNMSSSSSNQSKGQHQASAIATQKTSLDTLKNPMPQISFMRLSQTTVPEQSNEAEIKNPDDEDGKLNIEDNPDDSENNEDINSIIEYQHKILRKYTMMGMIQYCDAPFFHDMVDQRDYKMISIFEVFAINRNEDDFLENLGLFAQLVMEQDEEEDEEDEKEHEEKEPEEDLSDPKVKTLFAFKDKLTPEEYEHCKNALKENGKNIGMTIQVYDITKDKDDFIHSIKKLFKLGKK